MRPTAVLASALVRPAVVLTTGEGAEGGGEGGEGGEGGNEGGEGEREGGGGEGEGGGGEGEGGSEGGGRTQVETLPKTPVGIVGQEQAVATLDTT